jgi:hemerythrin-like domain-containing protein
MSSIETKDKTALGKGRTSAHSGGQTKTKAKAKTKPQPQTKPRKTSIVSLQNPVKMLSAREIMLHLHNEHKYMSKLLNILREQMELIDKGETPDLAIMNDVACYMSEYSDSNHHPKEDIIYKKLSESGDSHKSTVVNLLIDHEASSKKIETLLSCIRNAQRIANRDNLKMLHLRCEDYIASMNRHMDLEESQVFPLVLEVLSEEDWTDIISDIQPGTDPLFGRVVEMRYQDLSRAISTEMERAAEDFAMAELVGLGAAMENIGAIATYSNGIGKVLSKHFKQAYKGNMVAYRKLWQAKSRSAADYMSVTIDCALNNYDTCTDAIRDVGKILRKARSQIAEPYTSRLRIYHDMVRSPVVSEKVISDK